MLKILHKGFFDTSFDYLSVIGILKILLNILYCYGYIQGRVPAQDFLFGIIIW